MTGDSFSDVQILSGTAGNPFTVHAHLVSRAGTWSDGEATSAQLGWEKGEALASSTKFKGEPKKLSVQDNIFMLHFKKPKSMMNEISKL